MDCKIKMIGTSQDRAGWLAHRLSTIGGSEISTICGLNKYKTRLQLWAEKTGKLEPELENDAMRLGSHMEPFIVKQFARTEKKVVVRPDILFEHKSIPWATCTPDGLVEADDPQGNWSVSEAKGGTLDGSGIVGMLECKNVNYRGAQYWEDQIPTAAHMQTVWGLGVLGLEAGYVAALIGADANSFVCKPVQFSAELFDQMLGLGEQFMNFVKTDTPPEASAVADMSLIEKLNPRKAGKIITFTEKADLELFCEFQLRKQREAKSKEAYENDEKDRKIVEAKIRQKMGDATIAVCSDFTYKLSEVNKPSQMMKAQHYFVGRLGTVKPFAGVE